MGPEGRAIMERLKRLVDPEGLLNPGVLINENPDVAVFLTEILNQRIQVSKTLRRVGQYHILGVLGSGGMATVFEGYHPILQIPVAIKMLGHGLARRHGFMDRFREEGKLLASSEKRWQSCSENATFTKRK